LSLFEFKKPNLNLLIIKMDENNNQKELIEQFMDLEGMFEKISN